MIHDRFCQLGTDKDVISPDECWSCDWVQRIRDDERSHMGIIDVAYTAGVQAARDAVAGVEMGGEHFWSVGFRDGITIALDAIDALREDNARP